MLSQSMCTCPNHLGLAYVASRRTPNQQADPLETKLSKYSINYLNSSTKTTERRKVMEAININTGGTYFTPGSEKAQAIPLYCLPDKKAIHGLPQHVEEKIREIDASNKSNQEKDKEKKKLEDWKSKAVAQYSEDIVFNKIHKIAKEKGEECLVLTGYKSETYLCSVREKGKATRSSPTDPLNDAEKDVAELLGLDLDATQVMSDIMAELPSKVLNPSDLKNNDGLKKAIKTVMFEKKMRNTLETLFRKTSAPLNESTLKNVCEYSSYVHQLEKASLEVDHLTIFPHQKIILQVETKSVMNNPLSKLKDGANQCNTFCHLFSKCHGDILIPGYTFIKVVALPMIENQSKLVAKSGTSTQPPCDSCKSYIWTQEELEKVDEWMASNILTSPAGPQTSPDYKDLFNRLVGFMSLSSLEGQFFHTEEEASTAFDEALAGEDAGITAEGVSQEQQGQLTIEKLGTIKLGDVKAKPLSHIDTFILWNSDQLTLILQNPERVCLSSYFGTGKSLLLKYMAKRKAEQLMQSGSSDKSVFVSLGAADDYYYKKDWEIDTVYDIATRMEFSNTGVLFYSNKDLLYKVTTPQERGWFLELNEIDARLDGYSYENIVESARDLVNMVTTQYEITKVGDNDESEDNIEDQIDIISTLIKRIEDGGDEDHKARCHDLANETCTLLMMVRTLTLETIMCRLILENPSYSYFFDEVCVRCMDDNGDYFNFPQLTNVWTVVTGSIWLALRPTPMLVSEQSEYNQEFTAFKTELEQNNVHFPGLAKCMRNTSNILQLATIAQYSESTTSNSSSLPLNTISGPIPKLVICDDENEVFTSGASCAINTYIRSEPLVILSERHSRTGDIAMSCPERDGSPCLQYNPGHSLTDEEEEEEEENLKMYLRQPKGILITTPSLFNGCQAKHVITCMKTGDDIRSAILRARVTSVIVTYRENPEIDELKKICQIVEL